jgi:hypothetical protein
MLAHQATGGRGQRALVIIADPSIRRVVSHDIANS